MNKRIRNRAIWLTVKDILYGVGITAYVLGMCALGIFFNIWLMLIGILMPFVVLSIKSLYDSNLYLAKASIMLDELNNRG